MGRNNERNIKKHNDKLHKEQDKAKKAAMARKEKLKQITKQFNANKQNEINNYDMEHNDFNLLQQEVQKIIDLIAAKNGKEANNKLVQISQQLDDFIDFSVDDADLIEISKYQVLLNQLHQKINELN